MWIVQGRLHDQIGEMAALLERGDYREYVCRLAHVAGVFIAMGESMMVLLTDEEQDALMGEDKWG